MRVPALLLAATLCACAGDAGGPGARPAPSAMPAPLRDLVLNEGHPTALPVEFRHARHAEADRAGSCAACHHELRDRPSAVPAACTACHLPLYLAPEVDESLPHDHGLPPDL